ncbi:MAG: hypothetical protein ABFC98_05695 [Candidatus Cloacimonas sp.]
MPDLKTKQERQKKYSVPPLPAKEVQNTVQYLSADQSEKSITVKKHKIRRRTRIRPIILLLTLCIFSSLNVRAQVIGSMQLGASYSDNVFHLSEYDLDRFDDHNPNLDFVNTTDDLALSAGIDLGYPVFYRWWKFTPSVTAKFSQNVSNEDKYRTDWALKLRADRYYWNCSLQYASSPYIYFRHFVDSDGTDELEKYSYSRDSYQGNLAIKPFPQTTVKTNLRYDVYKYNEYFTEGDGSALEYEVEASYKFPYFSLEGSYAYRDFTCDKRIENKDSSYQSNIYNGKIILPKMPLSEEGKTLWQPSFALNYEQKYYQGNGTWYGGRADYTYNIAADFKFIFSPKWNLSLDYSHFFRNIDSDNDSVLRLKEYGENRLSAVLKYNF